MNNSYDAEGNRVGPVVEGPDGQELYCEDGWWVHETPDGEKKLQTSEARALVRRWGKTLPELDERGPEGGSIINSLKRLERAGAEYGKTAEKLRAATVEVASTIGRILDEAGLEVDDPSRQDNLPGGVIAFDRLDTPTLGITLPGNNYQLLAGEPTRAACLEFASALAGGWLDELAAWLEQRADQDEAARERIELEVAKLVGRRVSTGKASLSRFACSRCGELKALAQLRLCLSRDKLEKVGLSSIEEAIDKKVPVLELYCESCLIAAGENPTTIMTAEEIFSET